MTKYEKGSEKYVMGAYDKTKKCEMRLIMPIEVRDAARKVVLQRSVDEGKYISFTAWIISLIKKELE
jgi:hypothetical protein